MLKLFLMMLRQCTNAPQIPHPAAAVFTLLGPLLPTPIYRPAHARWLHPRSLPAPFAASASHSAPLPEQR
jgi:hypothetical protein